MTIYRLAFAGIIKKAEHRTAGDKQIVEVSICKKNKTKEGEDDSYTWIRITVWQPPDFMAPRLVKGSFIAGSGEMTTRSYEKDGVKATAIEVRCQSFDVEVETTSFTEGAAPARTAPPARVAQRPIIADNGRVVDESEIPF